MRRLAKGSPLLRKMTQPLMKMPLAKENQQYLSFAERCDPSFIFIVKGDTVFPHTIRRLKDKLKIPCISYQWDDPFYASEGQSLIDECRGKNFINGMMEYDHIFVFDQYYVDEIKKRGCTKVNYLPLATDDEVFRKVPLEESERIIYGYDVCFVGAPCRERLEIFNSLNGFNVGVFGDKWNRYRHRMKGNYFKGEAYGEKVLKLYAASKIILNIHHPQSVYGLNTRTFDIPSCGAFEIVDYKEGLQDLFDIGKEIVCYRSVDELRDLIRYYLAHPEERKRIVEQGYARVKGQHTWYQRMKEVIKVAA
jgi:spore maturation protein CgeB